MRLDKRKTRLSFVTSSTFRYRGKEREIVVEAQPYLATVRLAGTQQRYAVSWTSVYQLAGEIFARKQREARKAERKRK